MELTEYWFEQAINALRSGELTKARCFLEHYKKGLLRLEPRSYFEFGRYPVFNVSYPPNHRIDVPLVWEVLERDECKILAISKNSLLWEMLGSNRDGEQLADWRITDWAHSLAREELNSSFVNTWFNNEERSLISPTTIPYEYLDSDRKKMASTVDRLFFLSAEEVDRYYADNASSPILFSDRSNNDSFRVWMEPSPYWTRSLGEPDDGITSMIIIDNNGERDETRFDSDEIGWRPTMWIHPSRLDALLLSGQS